VCVIGGACNPISEVGNTSLNELPRCKHTRCQIPKKQIPNSKKGKYDASIGELNPKRLKKRLALVGDAIVNCGEKDNRKTPFNQLYSHIIRQDQSLKLYLFFTLIK